MLFDSHAHYDDKKFDDDRETAIKYAFSSGISYILNASSDIESSYKSIAFSEKYSGMFAAVGVHPHCAKEMDDEKLRILRKLSENMKVVAIGEIGLDYYYDFSPRDVQKKWFESQLDLAQEVKLPVIIHSRDATEETINILRKRKGITGVLHAFSGSVETADIVLGLGFHISIGGAVTFKNARHAADVAKHIPLDRLLIETDCPYMAPVPHRGKRSDSSMVRYVAEKIAELRCVSFEDIAEATTINAMKLFGGIL